MAVDTESVLHELSTSFTEFKKSIQIKLMKDKGSYISLACTWLTTTTVQTLGKKIKKLKEAKNTLNSSL
jgi:hypothetical protein